MFAEWPEKQNPGEDVHCPQPQNIFPALPFALHASGCFQDVRFKCRQMLKAREFYCNFQGTYFMFWLTCEHWAVLSVDIHDGFGLGSGLNSNENHPASRQFRLLWEFSEKCNCTPLQVRNNNKSNCKAQMKETSSSKMYLNSNHVYSVCTGYVFKVGVFPEILHGHSNYMKYHIKIWIVLLLHHRGITNQQLPSIVLQHPLFLSAHQHDKLSFHNCCWERKHSCSPQTPNTSIPHFTFIFIQCIPPKAEPWGHPQPLCFHFVWGRGPFCGFNWLSSGEEHKKITQKGARTRAGGL